MVSEPELDDAILELLRQGFDYARAGEVAALAELLAAGCPANLTDGKGDSLLILAAYHQRSEAVQLLLDHGADVERVNDNGQTALGSAVFRQDELIVELLLAAGADPRTGERSALDVAEFFNLESMKARLSRPAGGR
ncbi:MAG: ankyrin [Frankiales bacterium]|nr:ankyrin [Frankiales bacterium]